MGYKVNSERAVQFRKSATGVIEQFTIKAYVMDLDPMVTMKGAPDWSDFSAPGFRAPHQPQLRLRRR